MDMTVAFVITVGLVEFLLDVECVAGPVADAE